MASRHALAPNFASPAIGDTAGGISGKVTSATTKVAIAGIEVCGFQNEGSLDEELFNEEAFFGGCATTGPGGEYTISDLGPGSYTVEFDVSLDSENEFQRQYYDGKDAESQADPVPVKEGSVTSGIDAALQAGGSIAGTVTSAAKKTAIDGIEVCALEEAEPKFRERCAVTAENGEYTIAGLAPDAHDVEFSVPFESTANYATQYYEDEPSLLKAEPVMVIVETTKHGIDAALSEGGQITGTVTSASSHEPLPDIEVCAFPASAELGIRCTTTGADGAYDLASLSADSYDVAFIGIGGEYMTQYYKEASSLTYATLVAVALGGTASDINAALKQEVPDDVVRPKVSGSAIEGQTLHVIHGSWTNAPVSYQDEWGLCAASGELSSCHTVATGESYVLTSSDVGHAVRVRESASNVSGKGLLAYSASTAPVTALPPAPPPPAPAPSGAGGVLSVTTAVPSLAQLKALLSSVLVPKGKGAEIGALLKQDGYKLSLNALSAGQLVISWYLVPKGAHLAKAKPVLAAAGRLSFTKAGIARFTIKLTTTGRRLLKHAKRIELTAKGVLISSGQGTVGATTSFALRR
ncbi:MAG: collagen binding domain-containing protein [Solirubrobacteraceae bacterium]